MTMRWLKLFFPLTIFFWLLSISPCALWSQLILGQYEDEAPLRTWNTLGITTAPSLAMGEVHFTLASDCSAALSNPALLSRLPKITFTLNSSFSSATLFKYSLVNTGVLSSDKNLSLSFYAFDFAGASVRVKNWTFALGIAFMESYDRPITEASYMPGGRLTYSLNLDQEGHLKNLNFAISRKISNNFSAGIGLNLAYGYLKKDISEKWIIEDITITDSKSHDFQGLYFNGGIMWDITDKLEAAVIFRTPYARKSESKSMLRYYSLGGNTDIKIEASSDSEYKQPFVAGIGISYEFSKTFKAASDFTFFNWSRYKINYFEEELGRNFKDIIKIGAGVEYMSLVEIFNQKINVPFRVGIIYDPQPMREPDSSYLYLCFGSGLHWGKLSLDIGTSIGQESGSGNSLSARKVILSLTLGL